MAAKLQAIKVGGQKKSETFWVRGYVFSILYSELLLFGRPGFDPRTLQTLRLCSFVALWSIRSYTTSFKSPIIPLLGFKSFWS